MVKDEHCNNVNNSRKDFQLWSFPKPCDVCRIKSCLLFCKADSAFLCDDCDVKVHGANKLASRHERVWMCEVCEQAPAAVTCKADAAVLCDACDADIHSANPLARRHERMPVAPFFECARLVKPLPPSSVAVVVRNFDGGFDGGSLEEDDDLAASWLLPNPKAGGDGLKGDGGGEEEGGNNKGCFVTGGVLEFFADVDPYLDLEYASSMETGARVSTTDSVVPVQSHGHGGVSSSCDGFDADQTSGNGGYGYSSATSLSHSVSSSEFDVGVVPEATTLGGDVSTPFSRVAAAAAGAVMFEVAPHDGGAAIALQYGTAMDREAKVMRYKEKRKNRKFEKTIRYASRKAYAETRPRIKGRFAKRTDVDVDHMYTSPDLGYGLVPSF